jgi:hypothetical protein
MYQLARWCRRALMVAVVLAAGCTVSSTTMLTGPNGERWDAKNLEGACLDGSQANGPGRVREVNCSAPTAVRVVRVTNSIAECPASAVGAFTWPAKGPDPTVVLCFRD